MRTFTQENENIPQKLVVILFEVTVLCCKCISLKTALTNVVEISCYKYNKYGTFLATLMFDI